ncbi:MAG: butyryl-CoA dehydrogenase, partial [Rhodospirillaceae bacterium]|nr:butyryl-CoA dehydrogenase [Rhodospirillaceae bacterium]
MSNYRLTDEQRQLKEAARRFAEEKLRPIALETERKGAPMPREALKLMAEHGYVGLDIPTEYGGLGLDIMG